MFAALGAHAWAYPMLEVAHLLGVALLLGNLTLLELRVFGWGPGLPVEPLAKLSLALVAVGFGLAGCNAGWFHARRSLQRQDRTARLLMLLSSALWLLVLTCGRWIGYV